jgi:hypothetical protein
MHDLAQYFIEARYEEVYGSRYATIKKVIPNVIPETKKPALSWPVNL